MPNSLQSSAIGSPASRRATNCSLSSIAEHSFQGIGSPPSSGRKCHLCVRYDVLPMSQAAHPDTWVSPTRTHRLQNVPKTWVTLSDRTDFVLVPTHAFPDRNIPNRNS